MDSKRRTDSSLRSRDSTPRVVALLQPKYITEKHVLESEVAILSKMSETELGKEDYAARSAYLRNFFNNKRTNTPIAIKYGQNNKLLSLMQSWAAVQHYIEHLPPIDEQQYPSSADTGLYTDDDSPHAKKRVRRGSPNKSRRKDYRGSQESSQPLMSVNLPHAGLRAVDSPRTSDPESPTSSDARLSSSNSEHASCSDLDPKEHVNTPPASNRHLIPASQPRNSTQQPENLSVVEICKAVESEADFLGKLSGNPIYDFHVAPLKHVMKAKATSIESAGSASSGSGGEGQKTKAYMLSGIAKHVSSIVNVIRNNGFKDERERDHVDLLNIKTRYYREEAYKSAGYVIPFVVGGLFVSVYFLVAHFFLVPAWFALSASTVGLAIGKDLSAIPFLHNPIRDLIAYLAAKISDGYKTLKAPVEKFTNLTTNLQPVQHGVDFPVSSYELGDQQRYKALKKSYDTSIRRCAIIKDEPSSQPKKLYDFNSERPCVAEAINGQKCDLVINTPVQIEITALGRAIDILIPGGNINPMSKDYSKLYVALNNRYLTLRSKPNLKIEEHIRKVAQQARFLLEALYLADNQDARLNHLLLLQHLAETDPEEKPWLLKLVVPIIASVFISVFCMFAIHSAMLASIIPLLDMFVGAVIESKEANYNAVAAPTFSKLALGYLSQWLFSCPHQNQVLEIKGNIKTASLITSPECTPFLQNPAP